MHNSQKPKPLHRKQFNTENSPTPTKKVQMSSQSFSQSNNKPSQSVENSYSIGSSTVSYSQLQIILENVQQVKKKATEQIHSMEKKCVRLQEELKVAKETIQRYENLEETIKMEKLAVEKKYELHLAKLRNQFEKKQEACNLLSQKISQLTMFLNSSEQQIASLNRELKQQSSQNTDLQHRYKALTSSLNITEQSPELHLLLQNYKDLPSLLSSATSMSSVLQTQSITMDQLTQSNEQMKYQLQQTNQIMANITSENKELLNVISVLTKQKDQLNSLLKNLEQEKVSELKEKDCTLLEIEEQIVRVRKDSQQQVTQRQEAIADMRKKIIILESQVSDYEEKQKNRKQESRFKAIVDQVCDQYADYENVLKRIEYLEKYRSEYYFNVEKIQYLCKMLDS